MDLHSVCVRHEKCGFRLVFYMVNMKNGSPSFSETGQQPVCIFGRGFHAHQLHPAAFEVVVLDIHLTDLPTLLQILVSQARRYPIMHDLIAMHLGLTILAAKGSGIFSVSIYRKLAA